MFYSIIAVGSLVLYLCGFLTGADIVIWWATISWVRLLFWFVWFHSLHLIFFFLLYSIDRKVRGPLNSFMWIGWVCFSVVSVYSHDWFNGFVCLLFFCSYVDVVSVVVARSAWRQGLEERPGELPRGIKHFLDLLDNWDNFLDGIFGVADAPNYDGSRYTRNNTENISEDVVVTQLVTVINGLTEISANNDLILNGKDEIIVSQRRVINRDSGELKAMEEALSTEKAEFAKIREDFENYVNVKSDSLLEKEAALSKMRDEIIRSPKNESNVLVSKEVCINNIMSENVQLTVMFLDVFTETWLVYNFKLVSADSSNFNWQAVVDNYEFLGESSGEYREMKERIALQADLRSDLSIKVMVYIVSWGEYGYVLFREYDIREWLSNDGGSFIFFPGGGEGGNSTNGND